MAPATRTPGRRTQRRRGVIWPVTCPAACAAVAMTRSTTPRLGSASRAEARFTGTTVGVGSAVNTPATTVKKEIPKMTDKPSDHGQFAGSIATENYIPVTESGCWIWMGRICTKGYGQCIRMGRSIMAHRLFYSAHKGEIPQGMLVCHKCDTRLCVNPAHLFLGSHDENMFDMTNKGRQATLRGAANGRARLSESDVAAIRASAEPTSILLRRFGVSRRTIQYVRNGKTWSES